jgi:hypothetical protein
MGDRMNAPAESIEDRDGAGGTASDQKDAL